ncbi:MULTISPECIES: hypothetical protein [Chryseobacterium]|uniref:HTTM domain-containing protein n=1 Tax=Chryseobacterium camelliae TaxID=1265445 RepID=A0ABU0TD03_9FLAO|nr:MULTISPECIES: hypothetical protein [Chryseobacterium]MDT3407257.1 hypothetical protein [Pseudacidovorax intermedius]MDQ1094954.1 hypothetical protein [Chryseobacterium camelliae]MDQ1098892.1 hypothetical protein [Chryseobacterium sp. SORGH_AS_1048]MDR6086242.1 hypothetical protein [Chryseobacterium sp. SORGH_AS_0909]MDR6130612.1 hypothetical protein [Chryseobacterium sp. SORGH_AS_1175]
MDLRKNLALSDQQSIRLMVKVVTFFWLVTKIWSYKTWITERLYPVIPPLDMTQDISPVFHVVLFCLSVILMVLILISDKKSLLIVLLISELISCSLDMVRWQPWEYMYMTILLLIIIGLHKPGNLRIMLHLFLVSVYLFSGLHKLNREFLTSIWTQMFLIDLFGFSMEQILNYKLFFIGLIIPVTEIVFAILLLISRSKRKISFLLMAMHVIVLMVIGPAGLKYNSVVWPWNLSLIFILAVLYERPLESVRKKILIRNLYWLGLWFMMPVLSFSGRWYQYFSFNLYSGKQDQMYICFPKVKPEMQPYFELKNEGLCPDMYCINLQNWAMAEIKSAPVPEPEIYKKVAADLKLRYADEGVKIFLYHPVNRTLTEL